MRLFVVGWQTATSEISYKIKIAAPDKFQKQPSQIFFKIGVFKISH